MHNQLETLSDGKGRHIITNIKDGGAAQAAGMENDMILIAMNGRDFIGLSHNEVVEQVKSGGKNVIFRCKLAVVPEESSRKDLIEFDCSDSDEK